MNRIIGLLFLTIGSSVVAQSVTDLPANSAPFNMTGQIVKAFDNRYEGVRGTYMFSEDFVPGTVIFKKGVLKDVLLNYDAYNNTVLAKRKNGKDVFELRRDLVTNFTLQFPDSTEYLFVKESVGNEDLFLLALSEDPILYYRIEKKLKQAEIGGAYSVSGNNYDEFVNQNTLYTKQGSVCVEVKKNKKGLVSAFPAYKDRIESFFAKNKIDFNNLMEMRLMALVLKP